VNIETLENPWRVSSSSDPVALSIVDGLGRWEGLGPHYSRRTPGSKTFTGIGQEIVLVTVQGDAVWSVVRQRTPQPRGSGSSRGRRARIGSPAEGTHAGEPIMDKPPYVWRNNMFRNLGPVLSSELIILALVMTYDLWVAKYGALPPEKLRTEVDPRRVKSSNPGCCYKMAGFHNARRTRGKLYLDAPCRGQLLYGECSCCTGASRGA
jgi:hypothetical protein